MKFEWFKTKDDRYEINGNKKKIIAKGFENIRGNANFDDQENQLSPQLESPEGVIKSTEKSVNDIEAKFLKEVIPPLLELARYFHDCSKEESGHYDIAKIKVFEDLLEDKKKAFRRIEDSINSDDIDFVKNAMDNLDKINEKIKNIPKNVTDMIMFENISKQLLDQANEMNLVLYPENRKYKHKVTNESPELLN